MIWEFIKIGTNGDRYAPPIVDTLIKDDTVAILRAKKVLYENNKLLKIKVAYPDAKDFEIGDVIFIEGLNKHYQIKNLSFNELPYVIIDLAEVI